jgi:hypothetical protein
MFCERLLVVRSAWRRYFQMFLNFKRRDQRKSRLSAWFAHERDGDMQSLDLQGVATVLGAWIAALRRERGLRRTERTDLEVS